LVANDLDHPIVVAAHTWATNQIRNYKLEIKNYERLDSIPFSSSERYFASLNKWEKRNMLFVNGAPDTLLELSKLSQSQKAKIKSEIINFASEGKRLIGLARKKVPNGKKTIDSKDINDLEWVGLVALTDPVRVGVKEALAKTRMAGIKIVVITGDFKETARYVMNELGMKVNKSTLFARTTPDEKLEIVKKLQSRGEVVAMMGDGVNDAPALAAADIGIVLESATDVARESADLILLDSSYQTIINAIEEGRSMFKNLRKIIMYLLSDAFEEIIAVMGALVLGMSSPVTAVQILWINLVSDGFPNLALTIEPKQSGIMSEPPRNSSEGIITNWMKGLVALVSVTGGLIALALFVYTFNKTNNLQLARSIAFATLGINSLVYVFSIRTLATPFWKLNPLNNKWLNTAVIAGFSLQIIPFIFPATREFFGIEVLNTAQWILVFAASIIMFIIVEMGKLVLKK